MTVLTRDILVNGLRRDQVFTWLADFSNHQKFMKAGFPDIQSTDSTTLHLPFKGGYKDRTLVYHFVEADDKFAGRRIQLTTDGKRLKGHLHFSLRTMKPSTDTMVTLHMDYDPGTVLGAVLDGDINSALSQCFVKSLAALKQHIEAELGNPA